MRLVHWSMVSKKRSSTILQPKTHSAPAHTQRICILIHTPHLFEDDVLEGEGEGLAAEGEGDRGDRRVARDRVLLPVMDCYIRVYIGC